MSRQPTGTTELGGRPRRTGTRTVVAAGAGVAVLVTTLLAVSGGAPGSVPGGTDGATPAVRPVAGAGPGPTSVCGFPDVGQISADGRHDDEPAGLSLVVRDVTPREGFELTDVVVRAGVASVLSFDGTSTYRVDRFDLTDGEAAGSFDVALELADGAESFRVDDFEVDDEGGVYLLDTLMGRRDLVRYDRDGARTWSATLPPTSQTEGRLLDLYGTVLWEGEDGRPVIGVHEGSSVLHTVAADGTVLGSGDDFPGGVVGQTDDGAVVLADREEQADATTVDLRGRTEDGTPTIALGATTRSGGLGRGGQEAPGDVVAAVSGPGGRGVVVVEPGLGFEWYDATGVRLGVWPAARGDLDQELTLDLATGVARDDGATYALTRTGEGLSLVRISDAGMAERLGAPVKYNAGTDAMLSGMGMGLGLESAVEYGYFAAGIAPHVALTVDDAWAPVADRFRVRYQVRGDPRLPEPVATGWSEVALPTAGGRVPLELPDARPGVYEVDAHLLDAGSGEAVSGACLRYTVGAEGADLGLEEFQDVPGWGGASALRGVQLADALGFGSHRVQLDFGAIVPDPAARPSAQGLDWSSLPAGGVLGPDGAAPADPFTELRAAGEEARERGVRLVVQLGSGGEAERAAVEVGTWEGWVRQIVAAVARSAPAITDWEPWNEPNATGFDDGADYVRDVAVPFAAGARAADPDVVVVGGNSLGFALDWWEQVVAAGGCDTMDVVGVHPYTGLNRSWEEEGFSLPGHEVDALRDVLAPCGDLPVWDTETGWWSDGVVNFWAGGADVARKLLWYRLEGVDEWTYFFSEGGWGETGNSWSAVQHDAYVKPLGAAAAATSRLLDRFDELSLRDAPAPGVYAVDGSGAGGTLLALWSDDYATSLEVAAPDGAVDVEVVDPYGDRRPLRVPEGGVEVPVGGPPSFLVAPAGTRLTARPAEPFGPDVLEGRPVRATSTHSQGEGEGRVVADASVVTSGTFDVREPWRSGVLADGAVDEAPAVTIETAEPVPVDRVAVATAGVRCCTAGLRDYTVELRDESGKWTVVAERADQLHDRVTLFRFEPVTVTAVRVSVPMTTERDVPVLALNYSGVLGGPHPSFMPLETVSDYQVAISAVRAWGPAG